MLEARALHPGTSGVLALTFEAGRRFPTMHVRRQEAPIRVHRAFPGPNGEAIVPVVHVGPGLLPGDRLDVDVRVEEDAHVIMVPQSALKVHGSVGDVDAVQVIRVRVADGGWLELHGGLVIPFPHARLLQRIEVHLASTARLLVTERWVTGRSLEWGRFATLDAMLRVWRDGVLRVQERTYLRGGDDVEHAAWGQLDQHEAWSGGIAVGFDGLDVDRFPAERYRSTMLLDASAEGVLHRALHDDAGEGRTEVYDFARRVRASVGVPEVDYLRYGS